MKRLSYALHILEVLKINFKFFFCNSEVYKKGSKYLMKYLPVLVSRTYLAGEVSADQHDVL